MSQIKQAGYNIPGNFRFQKTNEMGYYEVKDDMGDSVWLKAYSSDSSASDYIGNVLSEYVTTVQNKTAVQVTAKASWINSHLANAAEGNSTIWIGAFTELDYAAVNKETEYTDRVFDCVTFKKPDKSGLIRFPVLQT